MGIATKKTSQGTRYRAYWKNPFTKKKEVGAWEEDRAKAEQLSDFMAYKLKHERESFRPTETEDEDSPLDLTVSEVCMAYHQRGPMADSTRKHLFYHLKAITKAFGSVTVSTLDRKVLRAYEEKQRQAGTKQNTIQRRIAAVRSAFAWAEDNSIIDHNPIAGYRTKRGKDEVYAPPTPEEAAALYRVAPDHLKRVIIIGGSTGIRIGPSEIFKLRWDDLDIPRRRWRVTAAQKNREVQWRWVPLSGECWPLILAWYEKDRAEGVPWAITWQGEPIGTIKRSWRTAKREAGITRPLRPYDLRHYFATWALEGGADIKAVAKIMGHADETMILRRYQHVQGKLEREAVELLPSINLVETEESAEIGTPNRYPKEAFSTHFEGIEKNKLQ